MNATNPTTVAQRRYLKQFALVMASYVLITIGTRAAMDHLSGPSRLIAAALPMVPIIAAFIAILRFIQNTDEFKRRLVIESMAIAGGITAVLAACYGFLEDDYLPRLSIWWVWFVLMGSWAAAAVIQRWRYR
jgi:hypothetical protein